MVKNLDHPIIIFFVYHFFCVERWIHVDLCSRDRDRQIPPKPFNYLDREEWITLEAIPANFPKASKDGT